MSEVMGDGRDLWGSPAGRGFGRGGGGAEGAWLLAEAVRGLFAALVAAPGHPDLGPFYLLRGLVKAIRRQESLETSVYCVRMFLCRASFDVIILKLLCSPHVWSIQGT